MNSFDNLNKIQDKNEYKIKSFNLSRIVKIIVLSILVAVVLRFYLQDNNLIYKIILPLLFVFIVVDEIIPSYKYK